MYSDRGSADIGAILEAVQQTATSNSTMAQRVRELEAHTEAVAASNEELETSNRHLTIELGEVVQQRDDLAASLDAESERLKQLEPIPPNKLRKRPVSSAIWERRMQTLQKSLVLSEAISHTTRQGVPTIQRQARRHSRERGAAISLRIATTYRRRTFPVSLLPD